MNRKLLSILLVLTMMLTMVTAFALMSGAETAQEKTTVKVGDYNIVIPKGADIPAVVGATVNEVQDTDTQWESGWYVVKGNKTISNSNNNSINVNGDVKLILADGCKLTVTATNYCPGIRVSDGNSLTIYAGNTSTTIAETGALSATGNGSSQTGSLKKGAAGIGGSSEESNGSITINGGNVTAKGGVYGAGIGSGGSSAGSGWTGKDITINGGTITATGGGSSAAIGGGYKGNTNNIALNGGVVTANGGSSSVGVGAGKSGTATNISVDTSSFIKYDASSSTSVINSTAFHFTNADDSKFKSRYLRISPELCEIGAEKYGFFEDVLVAAADGGKTITLLRDLKISNNYTLPSNTTFALNNFNFSVAANKRLSGENIAFDIASDKDMATVNRVDNKDTSQYDEKKGESTVKVSHIRIPENQVWNIKSDIKVSSAISTYRLKNITINGNNHSFTGADDSSIVSEYIMSLGSATPSGSLEQPDNVITWGATVEVKDLKIKTNDKFERCVYVQSNKTLTTKRADVTFNNVDFDNSTSKTAYQGACIVNNWGDVTLKGTCNFITGENSYSAIDLTKTCGDATLTFDTDGDDKAVVSFTDGRTVVEKIKEPLIGFDVDPEEQNYVPTAIWNVTGYENTKIYESLRDSKKGYDFPVCEMDGVKYGSISKALSVDGDTKTIKLIADDSEEVRISEDTNITLDLNGYELSQKGVSGDTCIIVNDGTLLIKDGSSAKSGKITATSTLTSGNDTEFVTLIKNYAKLTINAGTFKSTAINGNNSSADSEYDTAECINNNDSGECIINGGKFEAIANDCGAYTLTDSYGSVFTIKKATIKATSDNRIAQCFTSNYESTGLNLTISDADFIANSANNEADAIIIYGCNNCDITDADINCNGNTAAYGLYNESTSGSVKVNSGSFTTIGNASFGIYNEGTATVTGGTYTATGTNSYGIYQAGTMTIGGKLNATGSDVNLYLPDGKTVTIGTGSNAPVSYGTNKMKVGVTTETAPTSDASIKLSDNGVSSNTKYFYSDDEKYFVRYNKGKYLELAMITVLIDENIEHGKITVDNRGASAGKKVKITAKPSVGYMLSDFTIRNSGGDDITSEVLKGTTITMPTEDNLPITVSASFEEGSAIKTGDNNNLMMYIILFNLMLIGLSIVSVKKIRARK